ncbi:MAG: hypothetical protein ACYCPN_01230 [Thermoplasmata archaeon]
MILTMASVVILTGTAASAMGYIPAPPSPSHGPLPATAPFAGPATLYLGFMPAGSECTLTSPTHPYQLPKDGEGQIELSVASSGNCSAGDWDEVFSATSIGNPIAGVYRVEVSIGVSTGPGAGLNRSVLRAFFYMPFTDHLLSLTVRVDLGPVFPAGGVSMNVAFVGPIVT